MSTPEARPAPAREVRAPRLARLSARVCLAGAAWVAGCGASGPLAEPASLARGAGPSWAHEVGLAAERVKLARARLDALSLRDEAWPVEAELLGRAQVDLARAHFERACELDPGVRALARPADLEARAARGDASEAEVEVEVHEARVLAELRPAALVAHLAESARAHLRAHDDALLEASRLLRESRLMAPSAPRSGLGATEARALERLGQRTRAREAWLAALGGRGAPADRFEAWIAFADHFSEQGRVAERDRALERAATERARVPAGERAEACERARAHAPHLAAAQVCP